MRNFFEKAEQMKRTRFLARSIFSKPIVTLYQSKRVLKKSKGIYQLSQNLHLLTLAIIPETDQVLPKFIPLEKRVSQNGPENLKLTLIHGGLTSVQSVKIQVSQFFFYYHQFFRLFHLKNWIFTDCKVKNEKTSEQNRNFIRQGE